MLFEVLGTFKRLPTKVTLVGFQGDVDTNMRGDMVSLDDSSPAATPVASQVKIVGAFAANMAFADMLLLCLGVSDLDRKKGQR